MKTFFLNAADITRSISDSIIEIEKRIGYKTLFGAVGGSYSLGLQNASSDIDCYMVVDCGELSDVICEKININILGRPVSVDFMCVAYQDMIREIEKYQKVKKTYPTVLHRTAQEKEANVGKKDICRPDFKRSILFRILLSDEVICFGRIRDKLKELKAGIRIVDIIDYQFTRIYGSYTEQVRLKELVPSRKYLYILHEICTCECLMHSTYKPPMHFLDLIDHAMQDETLKSKMINLYEQNRDTVKGKETALIPKDMELNEFIEEKVKVITCYLQNNELFDRTLCISVEV